MVPLSNSSWLYSAFVESALYTRGNSSVVTVFMVADKIGVKDLAGICQIEFDQEEKINATVGVMKLEDKYPLKYDLWKIHCKADVTFIKHPTKVFIFSIASEAVGLLVEDIPSHMGHVGCCLAGPLWRNGIGDKKPLDLISWVEFQKLLGVSQIILYAMEQQSAEMKAVLDYYERERTLYIIDWSFPIRNKDFRYFGQNLLLHDCLYRSRGLFNYTIYADMDEVIIPSLHPSIPELLNNITASKLSAFGFTNRFHHTHWKLNTSQLRRRFPLHERIPKILPALLTHKVCLMNIIL